MILNHVSLWDLLMLVKSGWCVAISSLVRWIDSRFKIVKA